MGSGKRKGKKGSAATSGSSHADDRPSKVTYEKWVWWPNQPGRRSPAEKEFLALPPLVQGELASRMKRFQEGDSRFKDVKDLGDGIKEIRHRLGNNHYRVLFAIFDRVCVALTCFYKNQQRTEKKDLDRAKARRDSYAA